MVPLVKKLEKVKSRKEVQRSQGQENWGGVQSLVFIAANRYWLPDKESRPGASGSWALPIGRQRFLCRARGEVAGEARRPPRKQAAAAERRLGAGVRERESFRRRLQSAGEKHTDLVNLTFFSFLFFFLKLTSLSPHV